MRKFHDTGHLSPRLAKRVLAALRAPYEKSVDGDYDNRCPAPPRGP
jgi:hypothetical protein